MNASDPSRRLRPRIIDSDWLVLRGLARSLRSALANNVSVGTRVLDYGCGTMPYRCLVEGQGGEYVGADFGDGPEVTIGPDGTLGQAGGSVDAVLSVQVLEHVRDLDRFFAEITRVLTEQGVLILSTHGTWLYHPHPEDHRRWTRYGLIHEIESRGFTVTHCDAIVGPLAWTTVIRLTGFTYVLRKFGLPGRFTGAVLSAIMNLRAVAEDTVTPSAIRTDNACIYLMIAHKTPATT